MPQHKVADGEYGIRAQLAGVGLAVEDGVEDRARVALAVFFEKVPDRAGPLVCRSTAATVVGTISISSASQSSRTSADVAIEAPRVWNYRHATPVHFVRYGGQI